MEGGYKIQDLGGLCVGGCKGGRGVHYTLHATILPHPESRLQQPLCREVGMGLNQPLCRNSSCSMPT